VSESIVSRDLRAIRILLVEDDADDVELMRIRFAEAGLRVELERVESRPTFRAALARGAVDLVIADYSLPRFDGMAVLELVAELRPDLPVVLISGVLEEDLAIETLKLGATDYVLKQRLDRLVPVVLRALSESEGRRRTLTEVRDAIREVRDRYAALRIDPGEPRTGVSLDAIALLDGSIGELESRVATALGDRSVL
jgi:DNA-binding NtrC family response regulator